MHKIYLIYGATATGKAIIANKIKASVFIDEFAEFHHADDEVCESMVIIGKDREYCLNKLDKYASKTGLNTDDSLILYIKTEEE